MSCPSGDTNSSPASGAEGQPKLTVGATVHHVPFDGEARCRAALVTRIWDSTTVSVILLHERSVGWARHVPQDETGRGANTWHWPA